MTIVRGLEYNDTMDDIVKCIKRNRVENKTNFMTNEDFELLNSNNDDEVLKYMNYFKKNQDKVKVLRIFDLIDPIFYWYIFSIKDGYLFYIKTKNSNEGYNWEVKIANLKQKL